MSEMMQAARLHNFGERFIVERVAKPEPRPTDVVVAVKACNLVPNLQNVLTNYAKWFPYLPLPKLPAIFGLDVAGEVHSVGSQVRAVAPGDRVYVNPGRSCGSCIACRAGESTACQSFTFQGYFGFGAGSAQVFEDYPGGGLAQFMTAPVSSLVSLPDNISYAHAARFGYLGTAYAGLQMARAGSGRSMIVTGATGTLGLCAVLLGLAIGVTKIFAVARNKELLMRLKKIDPQRIETLSYGDAEMEDWVKAHTRGSGADILLECLSTGAPASLTMEALRSLRRGGRGVCIGGMSEQLPIDPIWFMCSGLSWFGSIWFSTGQGQDMAQMAEAGTLALKHFDTLTFPLAQANEALAALEGRNGGFTNVVVTP